MKHLLTLLSLLSIGILCHGQTVNKFYVEGDYVVIEYNLPGSYNAKAVKAFYSTDQKKTWTEIVTKHGDIENVSPGDNKKIYWDWSKDVSGIGEVAFRVEKSNAIVNRNVSDKSEKSPKSNGISITGSIPVPTGNFADSDIDNLSAGGAAPGLGLGIKYSYFVSNTFAITGSIDFLFNALSEEGEELWYGDIEVSAPLRYLLIPINVGIEYYIPLNNTIDLYGAAGLAYTGFGISDSEYADGSIGEYTTSAKIGLCLGAGLQFNDSFFAEIKYLGLGDYDVEIYNYNDDYGYEEYLDIEIGVSVLNLTLGYKF